MIIIQNDMTVFFDIDDTLVVWNYPSKFESEAIDFNNFGTTVRILPHKKHIQQLKNHRARGHHIICWSAGGFDWCKEVIKKLNLEEYVDIIMCKPQFFYDDLKAEQFLPESKRVFFPVD